MSKEQTRAFIDKIHFLHYNAYRVDLDIKLAYNKDAEGKETVLLWSDGDGIAVPMEFMEEAYESIDSHTRAFRFLRDSLKDMDAHNLIGPDTVVVVGVRKESGPGDALDTIRNRMWCCTYFIDENNITAYDPILDPFNQRLDRDFGPNGVQNAE